MAERILDVGALIETRPIGPAQWTVIGLCAFVAMLPAAPPRGGLVGPAAHPGRSVPSGLAGAAQDLEFGLGLGLGLGKLDHLIETLVELLIRHRRRWNSRAVLQGLTEVGQLRK
jgi:hypothetical protein